MIANIVCYLRIISYIGLFFKLGNSFESEVITQHIICFVHVLAKHVILKNDIN